MVPEGLSALAWWWMRVCHPGQERFFLFYPNGNLTAARVVSVCDRRGYSHAIIIWFVCDACRHGRIGKISIIPEWQRQGLGRRLVRLAMREGPDYTWSTTHQFTDGRAFFPVMARETGAELSDKRKACEHIDVGNRQYPTPRLLTV